MIYPNPNDGYFTIEWIENNVQSAYSIDIINSIGKQVYTESISSFPATINIDLPAGLYHVKIKFSDGNIYVKKFMLQH